MISALSKNILFLSSFTLSIVLSAILCGCSSSPQKQTDPAFSASIYSNQEENGEEMADGIDTLGVTLDDGDGGGLGKISDIIEVGERQVLITLDFEYKIDENFYKICNVLEAKAENVNGWVYVANGVSIDAQNILYNSTDTKAFVPVTYSASLGEGLASYEDTIEIDLSDRYVDAPIVPNA